MKRRRYMVLEAAMGGEFFMYMQSRPTAIREDSAKFYAAAVVLGLEYMQQHDLVWRYDPVEVPPMYSL